MPEFEASFSESESERAGERRVRPLLVGAAQARGRRLNVYAHGAHLMVNAPSRFVQALLQWCDGDRCMQEIEDMYEAKWGPSSFGGFLAAMLDRGILVEAASVPFRALMTSRANAPDAPAPRWRECRDSDDRDASTGRPWPSEEVLPHDLAPAIEALTRALRPSPWLRRADTAPAHERPSPFCLTVLPRSPGEQAIGLRVNLNECGPRVLARGEPFPWSTVYRVPTDAACMSRAQAIVAISFPLRQADLGEAPSEAARRGLLAVGAALQRATDFLRATRTEMTCIDFDAKWLSHLTDVPAHEVLACVVLSERVAQGSQERSVEDEVPPGDSSQVGIHPRARLRWMPGTEGFGARHLVCASLDDERPQDRGPIGWGRADDPKMACDIALSELVERLSYRRISLALTLASGVELNPSIDPRRLIRFADRQYANAALGVVPYDDGATRFWVQGLDVLAGTTQWIPADCVYSASALPERARDKLLMKPTSSGCASDVDLDTALGRAAYEIIERDAFARHWLAQRPCARLLPESLPSDLTPRLQWLGEQGLIVHMGIAAARFGPVVVVGIVSQARGFCAVGSACSGDAASALRRALGEAETAAHVRLNSPLVPKVTALMVRTPKDHGDLFAQRRHFTKAQVLFKGGADVSFGDVASTWPVSARQRVQTAGSTIVQVELTVAGAPRALEGERIRTVRALIPDALPIAFGPDALPRGMGAPFSKAGLFPHPLP